MVRHILTLDDIDDYFQMKYSFLRSRLVFKILPLDVATADKSAEANQPGIYIYWNEHYGVIKVGKSQRNSRKRALDHTRTPTRSADGFFSMGNLAGDSNTFLILININDGRDMHWLLSMEYYLEECLHPLISSDRKG